MPDISWTFKVPEYSGVPDFTLQDDHAASVEGALVLRRLDEATGTTYDRAGIFYASEVILNTKACPALRELFGFHAWQHFGAISDEEVRFQLSNDGGTTWQWWDGLAWAATLVAVAESNVASDIDENLQTFALGAKTFSVKAFLAPSTDRAVSPHLMAVSLFGEWNYNYLEDLQRSIKRFVDTEVVPTRTALVQLCGENTFQFPGTPSISSVRVYDLTNDPNKETDLFDTLETCQLDPDADPTCQIVHLTGYVNGQVEVLYSFSPEVILATPDAEYTQAVLPSIVIQFQDDKDSPLEFEGTRVYDISVARWLARERHAPLIIESQVRITAQSSSKLEVLAIDDAIREAFRRCRRTFPSVNIHKSYSVVTFQGTSRSDIVSQELRTRSALLTVVGRRWSPAYVERTLTKQVIMRTGTLLKADAEVTLNAT